MANSMIRPGAGYAGQTNVIDQYPGSGITPPGGAPGMAPRQAQIEAIRAARSAGGRNPLYADMGQLQAAMTQPRQPQMQRKPMAAGPNMQRKPMGVTQPGAPRTGIPTPPMAAPPVRSTRFEER